MESVRRYDFNGLVPNLYCTLVINLTVLANWNGAFLGETGARNLQIPGVF